jgi:general secretion pathway protein G
VIQHPKRTSKAKQQAGFTIIEILIVLVVISILAGVAIQTALFAFDVARLGRSVANIRQISSAVMQYESNTSQLPNTGGATVAVSTIVAALGTQGGRIDPRDGWSNNLYYEPVTVAGSPTFRLWCYGKDGTPDGAITGSWLDFDTDVVLESGTFIQSKW